MHSPLRVHTLDENGLTEAFTIENLSDEPMPFMLAFHTTFLAQSGRVRQAVGREELRDENFLPTGEFAPNLRGGELCAGEYVLGQAHLSAFYEAKGDTATIADPAYREHDFSRFKGICLSDVLCTRQKRLYLHRASDLCDRLLSSAFVCGRKRTHGLGSAGKRTLQTRIWVGTL